MLQNFKFFHFSYHLCLTGRLEPYLAKNSVLKFTMRFYNWSPFPAYLATFLSKCPPPKSKKSFAFQFVHKLNEHT